MRFTQLIDEESTQEVLFLFEFLIKALNKLIIEGEPDDDIEDCANQIYLALTGKHPSNFKEEEEEEEDKWIIEIQPRMAGAHFYFSGGMSVWTTKTENAWVFGDREMAEEIASTISRKGYKNPKVISFG